MIWRILKKDLRRKRVINFIILVFVTLSTMFAASSVNNIITVTNGLGNYFEKAGMSDYFIATQGGENNDWMVNADNAIIIGSDPVEIARTLEHYLNHPEKLQALREAGLRYAAATDWEKEADKVYRSMVAAIREDEKKL